MYNYTHEVEVRTHVCVKFQIAVFFKLYIYICIYIYIYTYISTRSFREGDIVFGLGFNDNGKQNEIIQLFDLFTGHDQMFGQII